LLTYSEDFSNAAWTTSAVTITANTNETTGPTGGYTATKLAGTSSSVLTKQSITTALNTNYTLRARLKSSDAEWFLLQISDAGVTDRARAWYNISTGSKGSSAVTGSGVVVSYEINSLGSGWYELVFTARNPITTTWINLYPVTGDTSTTGIAKTWYSMGVMFCAASTTDQSYQRVTDWVSEQYAWAATKNVPWLRRSLLVYSDMSGGTTAPTGWTYYGTANNSAKTGSVTADGCYIWASSATSARDHLGITTASLPANTVYYLSITVHAVTGGLVASNYFFVTAMPSGASLSYEVCTANPSGGNSVISNTGTLTYKITIGATAGTVGLRIGVGVGGDQTGTFTYSSPVLSVGAPAAYQAIGASWAATYTALAIAAGYPISLYSDRAGTTATVGPDDPVGVLLDQSENLSGAIGGKRNLLTYSEDFSNAAWGSGVLGVTRGVRTLTADGANTVHKTGISAANVVGSTYWASIDVFSGGSVRYLQLFPSGSADVMGATVDAETGQTATFGSNVSASSVPISGGFRFTVAYTAANGNTTLEVALVSSLASARRESGVLSGSITIGRAQLTLASTLDQSYQKVTDSWFNGSVPGYHATAPSVAGSPNLRLDGNGRWYLDRDTTDDNLPLTWPTVLSESQLGPELVVNGDFSNGTTGWGAPYGSATLSITGGALLITATGASGAASRSFSTVAGKRYVATCDVLGASTWSVYLNIGTTYGGNELPGAYRASIGGLVTFFTATGTTTYVTMQTGSGTTPTLTVDNVSVKEVTGTNVIYTATGDYTTKDSGLILSGATDYKYPQRPSGDYGRIVMAAESKYDAKIIKYLDQKRGRSYQLGPELVTNGSGADVTGWVASSYASTITSVSGELRVVSTANYGRRVYPVSLTTGKEYLFSVVLRTESGTTGARAGLSDSAGDYSTTSLSVTNTTNGAQTRSFTFVATSLTTHVAIGLGAEVSGVGLFSKISVREILL
jgi:hypothetical protein